MILPATPLSPYGFAIETVLRVPTKAGETVDFRLNQVQRRLDGNWTRRNIVPKARQVGISYYCVARMVIKCLGEQNRRCVIISSETDATARHLDRVRFLIDNMKGDLRPETGRNSRYEITFPKTNSTIFMGTAGSRNFGRGDTITDLLCTEAAFWPDPDKIMRGLLAAAQAGEVTVESTGNGVGNWYHRRCKAAEAGMGYHLHFFPWIEMPEYAREFQSNEARDHFQDNLKIDLEEQLYLNRGVTLEQLNWRREVIEVEYDGDLHAFKSEYPLDLDECFQSTGYSFFRKTGFAPTDQWRQLSRFEWRLDGHPNQNLHYVIGGDVSAGVGRDASVLEVVCLETMEQVGEWLSHHHEPDEFGTVAVGLGHTFNNAYMNVENNNHGLTTLNTIRASYPNHLIHRTRYGAGSSDQVVSRLTNLGTHTDAVNRGFIIGTLRSLLDGSIKIHSLRLKAEMETFVERADGSIAAEDGCHDDTVIAMAMAAVCLERAGLSIPRVVRPTAAPDQFSLDTILTELERRQHQLPFRPQVGEYSDHEFNTQVIH